MAATVQTTFKQRICEAVEVPVLTRCCFCFPLRRGLIAFAYVNLVLTAVVACFLSLYITAVRRVTAEAEASADEDASAGAKAGVGAGARPGEATGDEVAELPRLLVDTAGLALELIMTLVFIVALHRKHVLLMKVYLYFEIAFSAVGFVYSLAFLVWETASELFLILFQLTIQIYLVILIWSSIVKMQRDGSVKYVRDRETV